MRRDAPIGPLAGIRRKLRAIAAVARDGGATEAERAAAQALRARLEQRLRAAGAPAGDWTDTVFRLGRRARDLRSATAPASPKGDWTDNAQRLGKALRRGYRKWQSE